MPPALRSMWRPPMCPKPAPSPWLSLFASRSLPQVILIISTLSRWQNILTEHLDALLQTAEIQPLGDAIIAQVRIPLDFLYSQLIRFLPPVAAAVTLALLGGWGAVLPVKLSAV